eukprot:scaffold204481_cov21-Prasinocladus_malaysianus.AAC.1
MTRRMYEVSTGSGLPSQPSRSTYPVGRLASTPPETMQIFKVAIDDVVDRDMSSTTMALSFPLLYRPAYYRCSSAGGRAHGVADAHRLKARRRGPLRRHP